MTTLLVLSITLVLWLTFDKMEKDYEREVENNQQ